MAKKQLLKLLAVMFAGGVLLICSMSQSSISGREAGTCRRSKR